MLARLRKTYGNGSCSLVKDHRADETFLGGKKSNKHESKKQHAGRGPVGTTPVLGMRDHGGKTKAVVVKNVNGNTIKNYVEGRIIPSSDSYTDEHAAYRSVTGLNHQSVNHSAKQFVDGMAYSHV